MPRFRLFVFVLLVSCATLFGGFAGAEGLELSGRVVGAQSTPLPSAEVTLITIEHSYDEALRLSLGEELVPAATVATRTDARGRFALETPRAGFYRLRVDAPGYAPVEVRLSPLLESMALPDAQLERESRVRVVVSGSEGEALPGVLVRARPTRAEDGWVLAEQLALTDEKGEASFVRSGRTRLDVIAATPGRAPGIVEESAASRLEIPLSSAGVRRMLALDGEGGAVERALVLAGSRGVPLGLTDEKGEILVELPSSETVELQVLAPEGQRALVRAALAQDPDAPPLRATFKPLLSASGRVTSADEGKPIAGALVWSSRNPTEFAVSDRTGAYVLPSVEGTRPYVAAASPGFLRAWSELVVDGDEGFASFSLAPAAAIEGVVVDGADQPLPDALVEASVHRDDPRGPRRGRFVGRRFAGNSRNGSSVAGRTDAEGRFRIGSLDPDEDYDVRAEASSFAPSESVVKGLEPGRTKAGVRVVMQPGQTLRGRIVDEEGSPLAGAEIGAWSSVSWGGRAGRVRRDEPAGRVATSDLEGHFALERLPSGTLDLVITRAGYAKELVPKVEMVEGEDRDLGDVALEPGRSLFGRVVDDEGAPLADASVYVSNRPARNMMRMNRPPWGVEPDAVTGSDGSFIVADRRRDETVSLIAHRVGYTLNHKSGVEVESADAVIIELEPASRVSGVVVDEDDTPVAGAVVSLTKSMVGPGGRAMFAGMGGSGESDSEGRFVIENVRPDTWLVAAGSRGFRSTSMPGIEVPRGEDLEDLEVKLSRGARLEGVVLAPDGSPARQAYVSIAVREQGDPASWMNFGGGSARTDAEGRFILEGLAEGDQTVSARHEDYPQLSRDVEMGEGTNSITLTFDAGLSVSGRVVDRGGAPVAGASARLTRPGVGWGAHSAESGPDGSFVIEGVEAGEYEASARASGYSTPEESVRITLVEAQEPAPLELVLDESAVIRGRVVGLESREYPDVRVTARSPEGMWGSSGSVDFEGNFLLEDVRAGEWTVQGRTGESGRLATAEVTLAEGALEASVDLDFGAGFTLTGRVLRGGVPVDGATVFASREGVAEGARTAANSEGRYSLSGLSPGQYRITAAEGFGESSVERTLVLDGDASLDLEFPSASVAGRVERAADREALVGAVVSLERLDGEASSGSGRWFGSGGATTNAEGRFVVEGLAAGAWRVRASLPGYAVGETNVSLTEGQTLDDLTLSLDPTEGLLLRVLDAMGRPVSGARLVVLDPAGRTLTSSWVEASEKGTLFVESVPAGTWEVIVQSAGSALGSGNATAPGAATTMRLERACSLQVTVEELAETPAPAELTLVDGAGRVFRSVLWGGQVRSSHSLTGGRVSLESLPPGTWSLTVVASDGRRWEGQAQTTPEIPARVTM